MSKYDLLNALVSNINDLLRDMKDILSEQQEKDDITVVTYWFAKLNKEEYMKHVIKKVLPFKEQIYKRDASFFYEQRTSIFMGLPQNKIDRMATLFTQDHISTENIDIIFKYFEIFVALAERYKKMP